MDVLLFLLVWWVVGLMGSYLVLVALKKECGWVDESEVIGALMVSIAGPILLIASVMLLLFGVFGKFSRWLVRDKVEKFTEWFNG